jgi:hypothetical protein
MKKKIRDGPPFYGIGSKMNSPLLENWKKIIPLNSSFLKY